MGKRIMFGLFFIISTLSVFSQILIDVQNENNHIITLDWEYENQNLDHYRVLRNNILLAETTETLFVDTLFFVYQNTYTVQAMGSADNSLLLDSASVDVYVSVLLGYTFHVNFDGNATTMATHTLQGQREFQQIDTVSYTQDKCIGFIGEEMNDSATLYTPPFYDSVNNADVYVTFYYYTPGNNGVYDYLHFGYGENSPEVLPTATEWKLYSNVINHVNDISYVFKAYHSGGSGVFIDNLRLSTSDVGLEEDNGRFGTFRCYPNPAKSYLSIDLGQLPKQQYKIQVVGVDGVVLIQPTLNENDRSNCEINVSDLANGMYFVLLKGENEIWRSTFYKQ